MASWSTILALLIIVIMILLLYFARMLSRAEIWLAHAARANKQVLSESAEVRRMPLFGRVRTQDGNFLETTGAVIVKAVGNSLGHLGIQDGSRLVARKVEAIDLELHSGDIVVVNGEAKGSNLSRRLRIVDHITGNKVSFRPDPDGRAHKVRLLSEVEAKVTHLLR